MAYQLALSLCKGGELLNLLDIVARKGSPAPWAEGEKIPWNDPAFSARMLKEHLTQEHDAASRRLEIVDSHVRWIHEKVLQADPSRILDLGCGPGLYANRFAALGHTCVGIDFSPASIAYAREQAARDGLETAYIEGDIRTADYGDGYDLVMQIFGEFNVFRPVAARGILEKAHRALVPGGRLLLESHTFEAVRGIGLQPPSWYSAQTGLFSEAPHLCLQENLWDKGSHVAIERYYIVDAATGEVMRHSSSMQAYTEREYRTLLAECGFGEVELGLPAEWSTGGAGAALTLILARKTPAT
jgi:SAM-dependent methyltransferase